MSSNMTPVTRAEIRANEEAETSTPRLTLTNDDEMEMTSTNAEEEVVDSHVLPEAEFLPPLEQLLHQPPYHLHMRQVDGSIEITGSHSPSLTLLVMYLRRMCRADVDDQGIIVHRHINITIQLCPFGDNCWVDRLVLGGDHRHVATAPMMIALIERVLSYGLVSTSAGLDAWAFRRDAPITPA